MLPLTALLALLQPADFPRIANLWGTSASATDYDRWARYDLIVLGSGSPAECRRFHREMNARNPSALHLATAPLMNLGAPETTPWMRDEWFVRRPNGEHVRWWAESIYTPNLLMAGVLEALVDQTADVCGDALSEGTLDGVFYDSVVGRATWLGDVDLNGDGVADRPDDVDPQWHEAQCDFFKRIRDRWPGVLILANDVDYGHAPVVNGRLFEGAPLLDRVANGSMGPLEAIRTLERWMQESVQPGITFGIMTHPVGWQGWRVGRGDRVTTAGELDRIARDFRRMRLGLLTTLMTDAYYAYDVGTVWYGAPFWYAEYNAPLGMPLGPYREMQGVPPVTIFEWSAGEPTDGLAIDVPVVETPEGLSYVSEDADSGWRRVFATDARQVPLMPGKAYRLRAECEVLAKPTGAIQFNVRTGIGGWEHHDKSVEVQTGDAGTVWHIDTMFVPDEFPDYAAEWHMRGAGGLRLRGLNISLVNETYLMREFEGGVAMLNPLPLPITVELNQPLRRLADDACPLQVIEVDDLSAGFSTDGAWERISAEGTFWGTSYRIAAKPGDRATWAIVAPSTDVYSFYACIPELSAATDAAYYSLRGGPSVVLDQRGGDGGWVHLFDAELTEGVEYHLELVSGGPGVTLADCVRVESRARRNDGAVVTTVRMDPLDGWVLLR